MRPGIEGEAGRPHHDALRDEIDAGVHQPERAEDPFRDRVSQIARVGDDDPVFQADAAVFRLPAVEQAAVVDGEGLDAAGDQEDGQTVAQGVPAAAGQEAGDDVAGQDHVDDEIRQAPFAFTAEKPFPADEEAHHEQGEDGQLHIEDRVHCLYPRLISESCSRP